MPISIKNASLLLSLILTTAPAYAETITLLPKAKHVYVQAAKAALVEIGKNGIAGLNGKLQDCYDRSMIRQDLERVQYCFAMHVAAMQYDMAVIKSLGGEGASPGMDLADAFEMATPTFRRAGFTSADDIQSVLQAWAIVFLAD